jgi:hypothetical protein
LWKRREKACQCARNQPTPLPHLSASEEEILPFLI